MLVRVHVPSIHNGNTRLSIRLKPAAIASVTLALSCFGLGSLKRADKNAYDESVLPAAAAGGGR